MQWPQMDPNGDGRRRRDAIASLSSDLMRELTAALAGLDTDIEQHDDSAPAVGARAPRDARTVDGRTFDGSAAVAEPSDVDACCTDDDVAIVRSECRGQSASSGFSMRHFQCIVSGKVRAVTAHTSAL